MATTVARKNCDITVTVKVQFHNHTGLPDTQVHTLVDRWRDLAQVYLNGPQRKRRWKCCDVRYVIDTLFGGAARNGYHQIDFRHAENRGAGRSSVNGLAGNPPVDIGGTWFDISLAVAGAHEIGHLVGLDDEYHNSPGGSVNDNPKPAGSPQSIMGQTWNAVQFLQEHIDKSMTALGATCPEACCPQPTHTVPTPPPNAPEKPPRPPKAPAKILQWGAAGTPMQASRAIEILIESRSASALRKGLHSESVEERWIAVVALAELARVESDEKLWGAVRSALLDDSPLIRLPAACALLAQGDETTTHGLVSLILSDVGAIGHPPMAVCDLAQNALASRFGEVFAGDLDTPEARLRSFQAWTRFLEKKGVLLADGEQISVVTTGAVHLTRRKGGLRLVVYHRPEDGETPAIRAALAKMASGGNCPTGGFCKTTWTGKTVSCETLDCQPPCVCHVWGALAGEDLKDLGKGRIDDAKDEWLYQCYCTKVEAPVEP